MPIPKGIMPPRYDKEFKEGAIKLIIEQGRQVREVSDELGVSTTSLRSWLKSAGMQPNTIERNNRDSKRIKELEAQNRELRKQVTEKDEVITVLKKSVGILSTR